MFGYTARTDDTIADALRSLARDVGWLEVRNAEASNGSMATRSTVTI